MVDDEKLQKRADKKSARVSSWVWLAWAGLIGGAAIIATLLYVFGPPGSAG